MVRILRSKDHCVDVFDPVVSPVEAAASCGLSLLPNLESLAKFDAVIGAVAHEVICNILIQDIKKLIKPGGALIDVKQIWPSIEGTKALRVWRL